MKYLLFLAASVSPLVAQEPGGDYKFKLPPPKPLTPQEELASFKIAPGFKIQLVASEPMIEAPIAVSWDEMGRMYVLEMRGFMHDITGASEKEPTGVVSILEDTNGDGIMDTRKTFADGLYLPRAVMCVNGGALVGEPPNLWFMKDTNGDGKADVKELVDGGFGARNGQPEHMSNSPTRFLDNWVYCSQHGSRYKLLPNGKWTIDAMPGRGQWGLTMDNYGRRYYNGNSDFLRGNMVPEDLYRRNPNLGEKDLPGIGQGVVREQAVWPIHPTPGVNRGGEGAIDKNTQKLTRSTATCGPGFYRSELLGKDVLGNAFIPEPAGNLVKRFLVTEKDGLVTADNVTKGQEFLASTDERFRPVNCYTGPDGAVYIIDMYRGILQHKGFLTPYLKENIAERKLDTPVNLGRIWRVVPENAKGPIVATKLPKETAAIIPFLGHENGWVRDTAQRLLVERQDKSVAPAIAAFTKTTNALGKIHALWTLEGLNSLTGAVTGPLLKDPDPKVRAVAVRLADRTIAAEAAKLATDPSMDVKIALAFTSGLFPETAVAIPTLMNNSGGNAIIRTAISSGLRSRELEALEAMLAGGQPAPEALVSDLAAAVMTEQKTARVKQLLTILAKQPANSPAQSAMLSGIGKGGKGNKVFYLDSQPPELAKLAATLDVKHKPLLDGLEARIAWPGKPGMPPPPVIVPLSAAEQKLFDTGKQVYSTLCTACHQPNGRGQEGVAPSLVDSEFVTGKPDVVPRIVLHGISGPIKVNGQSWALDMPPLGAALTDDQIAGVATYIRREWEHNASPVSVADVARLRADNKARTQSWTAEELGVGGTGGGRKRN